jgi:tetratricopeptide (TPR) repeat protein
LAEAWPRSRLTLASVAALALGCCLAATCSQVQYWQNNTTLYNHALQVTTGNYIAHSNLGNELMDAGKLDEAEKHYQEVIQLMPTAAKPYNNLGNAYAMQNKLDDAMAMFSKAIEFNPGLAEGHYNLGNAYLLKGKMAEAIAELKTALSLKPDDILADKKLAEALFKTGKAAEAIPYCEAEVEAEPEDAHAHFNLGTADLAGKRPEQALAHYKEAVRLAPDTSHCLNALAWLYATCPKAEIRNGAEAVRLATRACEITKHQDTGMLDTLAAAYAEAGRFDEAIKTTEEIRALAVSAHDAAMVDTAKQRLALYKSGKPYRDAK